MLDYFFICEFVNLEDGLFRVLIIKDFEICCISWEVSLLVCKEVLIGKVKFGIIGDGKEVFQVAMAKVFCKGDWCSGYYCDQIFMFVFGLVMVEDFFVQFYVDFENDFFFGGCQMNGYFGIFIIDDEGEWFDLFNYFNVSVDILSMVGQMACVLGFVLVFKYYWVNVEMLSGGDFFQDGKEISFVIIGDVLIFEGVFWEMVNVVVV